MREKKILLIEDSKYSQILIKEALDSLLELDVIIKNSAKNAITYLKKTPDIDLFLIDIGLPLMNGVTLLENINLNFPKYKNIPKIAITAHVMTTEIDTYFDKGFKKVISKPFKLNQFKKMVNNEIRETV